MKQGGVALLTAVSLSAITGCSEPPPAPPSDVVLSEPSERIYLRLAEADLVLGGVDPPPPELFTAVGAVVVGPAGRIWIAETRALELRVFDESGRHLASYGGAGGGPGEFSSLRFLGVSDEHVIVADDRAGRVTFFTADGSVAGTSRTGDVLHNAGLRGFHAGVFWGQSWMTMSPSQLSPGEVIDGEADFFFMESLEAPPTPVGSAPTAGFVWDGSALAALPFTANPGAVLDQRGLHLTSGTTPRIRIVTPEGRVAEYGIDRPAPTSREMRDEQVEFVTRVFSGETQARHLALLDHPAVPEYAPVWARLLSRPNGEIWARRYSPNPLAPGRWDVFDATGVLLGVVETPTRLRVMSIHGDHLYGVRFDDLDVPRVVRHPLAEPSSLADPTEGSPGP